MKKTLCVVSFLTLLFAIGVVPMYADVTLYSNGPVNGTNDAWTINYGYAVTDSFLLSTAATVSDADFAAWEYPGDTMTSVGWAITSLPFSGTTYGSGQASTTQTYLFTNGYGYDIDSLSFSIPNVGLSAGTYWFELQNAVTASGDPAFWDWNFGPSDVYQNTEGHVAPDSNTFQITGTGTIVPEPASVGLFGLLMAGAGLAYRRRLSR
jgi:hypothetical protein